MSLATSLVLSGGLGLSPLMLGNTPASHSLPTVGYPFSAALGLEDRSTGLFVAAEARYLYFGDYWPADDQENSVGGTFTDLLIGKRWHLDPPLSIGAAAGVFEGHEYQQRKTLASDHLTEIAKAEDSANLLGYAARLDLTMEGPGLLAGNIQVRVPLEYYYGIKSDGTFSPRRSVFIVPEAQVLWAVGF